MRQYDVDRIVLALVEEGQNNSKKYGFNLGKVMRFTPMQVGEVISNISIEPERKKGRWIVCTESCEETFHTGSRCSACNYWKPMGIWNYCPNCGAYMGQREE